MSPGVGARPSRVAGLWGGWSGRIVRATFALLPIAWLAHRLDLRAVLHEAVAVGAGPLALSFALVFTSVAVGCVRWRLMLRAYGATEPPSLGDLLRHNLVGQYFNVLPSGVAGDAVRGHRVKHCLPDAATSYTVIFVERLAGLLGLCLIAATAMAGNTDLRGGPMAYTLDLAVAGATVLSVLALGLPYALAARPAWRARVARIPLAGSLLVRIPPARSLAGPLWAVALSILTQGTVVASVAVIIGQLSPAATAMVCARIVPAVILFTYVPLTPGGVGQREWAFMYLFGQVGVRPDAAVATSLLFFAVMMALAAVGGVCLLGERAAIARAARRRAR